MKIIDGYCATIAGMNFYVCFTEYDDVLCTNTDLELKLVSHYSNH